MRREKASLRSISHTSTTPITEATKPMAASTTTPVVTSPRNAARMTANTGITRTTRFVSELVKSQLRAKSSV